MELKIIILFLNLFYFNFMFSQAPYSGNCIDISSFVSIVDSQEERRTIIIHLEEQDTISALLPKGEFEILKAVKNDFVINVAFRMPDDSFKNNICLTVFCKIAEEWIVTESYVPLSMRYMYEKVTLLNLEFPDINTVLASYVNEEQKINDIIFRLTKHGPVQYDCFDKTSFERKEVRNSFSGTLPQFEFRPSN